MSFQDRPSYQRPTKSSSSPSVTPARKNSGNVPLVRGLSPVRSPYYGRAQEVETQRSHDNPLFRSHVSDADERRSARAVPESNSAKAAKNTKENGETEEPWKVHVEKGQFGMKQACTTPGKTCRVATMQFTTPPKPVVKRKILSESNRDVVKPLGLTTPRRGEESRADVAFTFSQEGFRSEAEKRYSETSSDESDEQKAPMVSIEELQKRIQKFLQTEPSLEAPVSPVQCTESVRRVSGVDCGGSPEPSVEDVVASYHPVFSPYSPRPEFLRARTRSPSPVAMEAEEEESVTYDQSPIPTLEKSTTPTSYDPKNNFLSPRPQFLRYRPLKRLELLRRSADALLNLDLDSPAIDSPPDSAKVESEPGTNESQEVVSIASEVLTPHAENSWKDDGECKWEERQLQLGEGQSIEYEAKAAESISENTILTSEICEISVNDGSQVDASGTKNDVLEDSEGEVETGVNDLPVVEYIRSLPSPIFRTEISVNNASQVDASGTKNDVLENSEGEVETEVNNLPEVEHIRSLPSRIFRTSVCFIGVVGMVLLVLAASGSPGILPESLHQNELSTFWRTSEYSAPVRKFLLSVEGLWREDPGVLGYPVNERYMEILRTNLGGVAKAMTFDSLDTLKIMELYYSVSASYLVPFSSHVAQTYSSVKKRLLDAADSYISQAPDVDEWDWVPEYDFVVAKDVFDWAEAYEAILAKVDSLEIKSIFQSLIDSNGAKSIHELVEDSSLENNVDAYNTIVSEIRFASPDIHLGNHVSNFPADAAESSKNQFTQAPDNELASGEVEEQVLLESLDQDNKEAFFGSSSPGLGGIVEDTTVSASLVVEDHEVEDVEPLKVILNQDGGLPTSGEDLEIIDSGVDDHEVAAVTSLSAIEGGVDMIIPFDTVEPAPAEQIQHTSEQLSQEASPSATENSNLLANQDTFGPQDRSLVESPKTTMVVDIEPNLSRSPLLPRLRVAMSPSVLAVVVASVVLAAVIAMILLRPARRYSPQDLRTRKDDGRTKKSFVDANSAQVTQGKLPRKPQRTFKTTNNSQPVDTGSNYLPGDSPMPAKLSSEYTEHFSTPNLLLAKAYGNPATERNSILSPERPFKPVKDRNSILSPERSFKQVSDKDSFMTPEIEVLEDSSLGRFTALVPVVHNEGTEKEEVKLTPVRRSSRIRSRLQSPCSSTLSHFSYSPEL